MYRGDLIMHIRKATMDDFHNILSIYEHARSFMAAHGNPTQWGTYYPPSDMIHEDISKGFSYVCENNGKIIAVFYYRFGEDETYQNIFKGQWSNDNPYGVVHRLASTGTVKGAATYCLNWAFEQCHNLRIDTHDDNVIMQNLLTKLGFKKCGRIKTDNGSERIAYQKSGIVV